MRKIRLDLQDLSVESFAPAGKARNAGTVRGNDSLMGTFDNENTCVSGCGLTNCATCQPAGCPGDTGTCFASCARTDGFGICIDPGC